MGCAEASDISPGYFMFDLDANLLQQAVNIAEHPPKFQLQRDPILLTTSDTASVTMLRLLAASFTLPVIYASPLALPQAVTDAVAPSEPPPVGCMPDFSGTFGIAVVNISSPSAMKRRQADEYVKTQLLTIVRDNNMQSIYRRYVPCLTDL